MDITTKERKKVMRSTLFMKRFILMICGLALISIFPYTAHSKQKTFKYKHKKQTAASQKAIPFKKTPALTKTSVVQKSTITKKSSTLKKTASNETILQNELVKYLGTQYQRGGSGPDGLDCSGFSRLIYKKVYGIELPHNAASQSKCPSSLLKKVSLNNMKTGDLIFFAPSTKKQRINHVGIYLADGRFIHASQNQQQVVISNLNERHWSSKVVSTKGLAGGLWDEVDTVESTAGVAYKPDKKDTVRLKYTATIRSASKKNQSRYSKPYSTDQSHNLELGYTRDIYGKAWNVNMAAFRDQFFTDDGGPAYSHYSDDGGGTLRFGSYSQGIRMASDIKPANWLSLTPSVTYLCYGPEKEDTALPLCTFGLDVNLLSPSNRWSLSTGLQYSNLNNPTRQFLGYNNSVDMSVTYRQQLTDRLNFTLIGHHLEQSGSELEDNLHIDPRMDEQLAFMLNFTY